MKTSIISSEKEFALLRGEWDALALKGGYPLLSHSWIGSCIRAFHKFDQVRVVILRDGGELAAVAPLVVQQKRGMKQLEFVGAARLHEPSGFLFKTPDHLQRLLEEIRGLKSAFYLHSVRDEDGVSFIINSSFRGKGICLTPDRSGSPCTRLEGDWEKFHETLSGRRRYDLRRALKRAEEMGELRFEFLVPEPEELGTLLDTAFAVEASSWKGNSGSSINSNPAVETFFRSFSRLACLDGSLRLGFFHIDSEPAAMQIALTYGGRFWLLKIGYDNRFARCSPGNLLLAQSLQHAFSDGLDYYEFLGANEPWLDTWATGTRRNIAFLFYPYSLGGGIQFAGDMLHAAGRRFFPGTDHGRKEMV